MLKSHFASVEESQQKVAAGVNNHFRRCLPYMLPAMAVLLLQVSVQKSSTLMVARLCYLCFLFSTLPGHFCGNCSCHGAQWDVTV